MNIFSSLIPEPYAAVARIGVMIAVVGGAFVTGYIKGIHHANLKQQQAVIAQQKKVIVVTKKQAVVDTSAVTKLQNKLYKLRSQNDVLQREIEKLPTNLCMPNGNLAPSWVHNYNRSISPNHHDATSKSIGSSTKIKAASN